MITPSATTPASRRQSRGKLRILTGFWQKQGMLWCSRLKAKPGGAIAYREVKSAI